MGLVQKNMDVGQYENKNIYKHYILKCQSEKEYFSIEAVLAIL